MFEIASIFKILFFTATGGLGLLISVLSYLIKRELGRNKEVQKSIHEDISHLKESHVIQQKITYEHDKNIAVMDAEKIGRPELKEEMDKIQKGFEDKLNSMRDDIKEDIKDLKEIVINRNTKY